jgi:hypothetical protein
MNADLRVLALAEAAAMLADHSASMPSSALEAKAAYLEAAFVVWALAQNVEARR